MNELWPLVFAAVFMVIAAEAFAIVALARAIGLIQLRIGPDTPALDTDEGLAVGADAPAVSGVDLHTREFTTVPVGSGKWLLLFLSATCQACRVIARDAGRVSRDRSWGARVVLIARSSHEQNEVLRDFAQLARLLSDPTGAVHDAFAITRVPAAMLVEDGRVVAKGVVNNRDQLELLLEQHKTLHRPRGNEAWTPVSTESP